MRLDVASMCRVFHLSPSRKLLLKSVYKELLDLGTAVVLKSYIWEVMNIWLRCCISDLDLISLF